MEDRLQKEMDIFCDRFSLNKVQLPFITVDGMFVKLYNFLFSPRLGFTAILTESKRRRELEQELGRLEKIGKEALAEAKKGILWKEYLNDNKSVGASEFEKEDIRILGAAIKACDDQIILSRDAIAKKFGITAEEADKVIEVSQRIQHFHAEGKAIKEFRDLNALMNNYTGKIPLIKADKDYDKYVHECIHFVLRHNGIETDFNDFEEGICTYMHHRYKGGLHWWFGTGRGYAKFVKYFKFKLKKEKDSNLGPLLKRDLKILLEEFKQH